MTQAVPLRRVLEVERRQKSSRRGRPDPPESAAASVARIRRWPVDAPVQWVRRRSGRDRAPRDSLRVSRLSVPTSSSSPKTPHAELRAPVGQDTNSVRRKTLHLDRSYAAPEIAIGANGACRATSESTARSMGFSVWAVVGHGWRPSVACSESMDCAVVARRGEQRALVRR
jgi:hypothetical protein